MGICQQPANKLLINTPYINTISVEDQPPFPGDPEMEWRIRSLVRWNALAMVVRANRDEAGIGGHISTFASAATLIEIGFNHFFRGQGAGFNRDFVYFQGHSSPGIYARAFLEGRIPQKKLENFRRELKTGGGLSSYPHPWLMPDFWEFPTVSMGLGPLMGIYQARFKRYLEDRGLIPPGNGKIWVFLGDGEMDEPESLGAITLASREKLDNLIFVVNCNLQRLDGPVRGNGKIIQELEAVFHGAGWNVIKVIWGDDWDPLLAADIDGVLVQRMGEVVDGQYQKYVVESGDYTRKHFFGVNQRLSAMVAHLSDAQIKRMRRGGHDPIKVYSAFKSAFDHKGSPTLILAKTIKGYGLGESGEGKNITHQQKKLNEDELREFRTRFGIPLSDEALVKMPFYKPSDDSPEMKYLHDRRKKLGGFVPMRKVFAPKFEGPSKTLFSEFEGGTAGREVSTTMVFAKILSKLLQDKKVGKYVVPIVPDEARTFGMESLFRQCGIYAHAGQLYEPVDRESLLYYREAKNGQILEEGITEAGSMSSFIAAGSSKATHGLNMIPFFIFYSMFGFQRIGDLIWAAGDSRCKGFLIGATSGRTTLAGEGLQHQDGQSHVLALSVPNLKCYDVAFAYELSMIIDDGIRRMYQKKQDIFYYLTVGNENYAMPSLLPDCREGILKGLYRFKKGNGTKKLKAHLLGSGALVREALKAQMILEEKYDVSTDVWSITSYKELINDVAESHRQKRLKQGGKKKKSYIAEMLEGEAGVFVAASDYLKILPMSLACEIPGPYACLGTDGFGRSDGRVALRNFFEVDYRFMILSALSLLREEGKVTAALVVRAIKDLKINIKKPNPVKV